MEEKQQLYGLKLGKSHDGTILCGQCGQILGYLFESREENCYLHFICHCGNSGYLTREAVPPAVDAEVADTEGSWDMVCSVCQKHLVSVTHRAVGFSFRIQCSCGHRYDSTCLRRRPVYQEE